MPYSDSALAWVSNVPPGYSAAVDGVWREAKRHLRTRLRSVTARSGATTSQPQRPRFSRGRDGPEACSLVTADEIEAATAHRPLGPGDPKSGGMETDIGLFKVCEWSLTDGDEFLVNITTCRDQEAVDLARSRNWNEEKPLAGLGELARWKVNDHPGGHTELHVSAYQGRYALSFVHTSAAGATDISGLRDLMAKVLARLE